MASNTFRCTINAFRSCRSHNFFNGIVKSYWTKKQLRYASAFSFIGNSSVNFSLDGFQPNQLRNFYTGSPISLRLSHLQSKKGSELKISMITAYDHMSAKIADECLVDSILVGDSLGNVIWGAESTSKVGMNSMVYHSQIVSSAASRAFLLADLPFGSYSTLDKALYNSERLIREGGAQCVKLEGFYPEIVKEVSKLVPVCGHLGLLPQTAISMHARGKTAEEGMNLLQEALELEKAGCSLIVLEKVCSEVAKEITRQLTIPTIGIGSGADCDGQVLVWHDVIGLHCPEYQLKFSKKYTDSYTYTKKAVDLFAREVEKGEFPEKKHAFYMSEKEKNIFYENSSKTIGTFENFNKTGVGAVNKSNSLFHVGTAAFENQNKKIFPLPIIRRVLIRGSGSIGSLLASFLSEVDGVDVMVYTHWKEHAEAIEKVNGGRLRISVAGARMPFSSLPNTSQKYSGCFNVVSSEEELADHSFDVGFICVKSYDTENAVKFLDRKIRNDGSGAIISLQNGLHAFSIIRKNLTATSLRAIIFGTLTGGAAIVNNGVLVLSGEPIIKLTPLCKDNGAIANSVTSLLCSGGLQAETCLAYELTIQQWQKLAINSVINGLTSLFGCHNGALADPRFDNLVIPIVAEVCFVARKHGIPLEKETVLAKVRHTIENTASNLSSTLQDLRKGRKTEIDAICGAGEFADAIASIAFILFFQNSCVGATHTLLCWRTALLVLVEFLDNLLSVKFKSITHVKKFLFLYYFL